METGKLLRLADVFVTITDPRQPGKVEHDLVELRTAAGVHRLMPGLTGWAQINGRDELPIPRKVELDVEYLQQCSLLFDLKILWKTFVKVLASDGVTH